jgi:hypothetical protein
MMALTHTLAIRSENKYKSLITKMAYQPGDVLYRIPTETLHQKASRYTVQIGRDVHVEVGKLSALNHSCDPNVILDTERLLVIARRNIASGEELTFFYPSTEWEMAAPFICLCGAPSCIHVVAGARFLPLSVLEHHFLNRHIRELMIDQLNSTIAHLPAQIA